ncbi:CRISPR system precrRNA processing endoribonuclease RAMP protein Cas6 [Pseudanabaenaceae cyanobacterium LEGE 13415]|nr:CRISPR system precrRNA processing endoribonuclease RAMP protein Cas6 [Pseudanabaenaceae cyanobacterium LEGE 13415]
MPRRSKTPILTWSADTQLVAITLTLQPQADFQAPTHYATELHSWFLNQIRRIDPDLSAYLHDGQAEKAFSLSSLSGDTTSQERTLHFRRDRSYQWSIAALSESVCQGLQQWLTYPPEVMQLRSGNLTIQSWDISLPATTYETVWNTAIAQPKSEQSCLTFVTPTSFRKRSNHLPLPMPENVFHSYLRRWNHFASIAVDQAEFLDWINECVVILRHEIRSQKTQAGKQGSVTGFIGSVQFGLAPKAKSNPHYVQLFHALIACAPYFGTGHKVTFGLGQTQQGWFTGVALPRIDASAIVPPQNAAIALLQSSASNKDEVDREQADSISESGDQQSKLRSQSEQAAQAEQVGVKRDRQSSPRVGERSELTTNEAVRNQRQSELKTFFLSRKKRQGGERAEKAAELWAAILVGQEFGETLKEIAASLELPYETVKRYAGRAHQELERS